MDSPSIHYQKYRSSFKDCDILMFKGEGLLSSIIKWKTKSVYSHAGLAVWWNDRLMVLEAVGKGVEARPISYTLKHYHGSIDYFRPKEDSGINDDDRSKMIVYAQEQLGKEYAKKHLVKFFFKLLFNRKLSKKDESGPVSKFFCSQYVSAVYQKAGFDLKINLSDKFTSPEEIASSPLLENAGTIKE
jgi:hypothetical protein